MNKIDKPTYIYALVDPRGTPARYFGMTKYPKQRYSCHWNRPTGRVKPWIEELKEIGARPKMIIVDVVEDRQRAKRIEYDLIRFSNPKLLDYSRPRLLNTHC